jgi:hypothetical protein
MDMNSDIILKLVSEEAWTHYADEVGIRFDDYPPPEVCNYLDKLFDALEKVTPTNWVSYLQELDKPELEQEKLVLTVVKDTIGSL